MQRSTRQAPFQVNRWTFHNWVESSHVQFLLHYKWADEAKSLLSFCIPSFYFAHCCAMSWVNHRCSEIELLRSIRCVSVWIQLESCWVCRQWVISWGRTAEVGTAIACTGMVRFSALRSYSVIINSCKSLQAVYIELFTWHLSWIVLESKLDVLIVFGGFTQYVFILSRLNVNCEMSRRTGVFSWMDGRKYEGQCLNSQDF